MPETAPTSGNGWVCSAKKSIFGGHFWHFIQKLGWFLGWFLLRRMHLYRLQVLALVCRVTVFCQSFHGLRHIGVGDMGIAFGVPD